MPDRLAQGFNTILKAGFALDKIPIHSGHHGKSAKQNRYQIKTQEDPPVCHSVGIGAPMDGFIEVSAGGQGEAIEHKITLSYVKDWVASLHSKRHFPAAKRSGKVMLA